MSSQSHIGLPSRLAFTAPDSTLEQAAKDVRQEKLLRILEPVVVGFRHIMAITTLTVPMAYFVQFCIDGGVLRPQAFDMVGLGGALRAIVEPGISMGQSLFAHKLVHNGWNFVFAIWGILTLILRYQMLKPIRYAEIWLKDRRLRRAQEMEAGITPGVPTANQLARLRAGGVTRITKRRNAGII
jgi:hypothetical protein